MKVEVTIKLAKYLIERLDFIKSSPYTYLNKRKNAEIFFESKFVYICLYDETGLIGIAHDISAIKYLAKMLGYHEY
jgi:hypothetical protein